MDAQEAAQICGQAKQKSNKGWLCKCPSHDDNKSSLSLDDGDNGKLLFKCFAGCEQAVILSALQDMGVMNYKKDNGKEPYKATNRKPPPVKRKPTEKKTPDKIPPEKIPKNKKPASKIVATYDYISEEGKLLFQCVRKQPKNFLQRQPKEGGGWDWNLKGVTLVPFMLPELLAAKEKRYIFIVEGEKDALAMRDKLGSVATCCPMGAGSWKPEYNDYFSGALVVVVADNDDPGRRHANDVAGNLKGHAQKVRILDIPEVPNHGDISDWIKLGGTRKHLNVLVQEIFKEPMRELEMPEPEPAAPAPRGGKPEKKPKLPALGIVDRSGAVRKPETRPDNKPELATDSLMAQWELLDLVLTNNGRPVANLDNALRVIEGHKEVAGRISYDEFYDRVRTDWGYVRETWKDWTDSDTRRMTLMLQRELGIQRITSNQVDEAIMTAGYRNIRNEPKEWMTGLEWDGKLRLRDLMIKGFGAKRDDYTEAVGRCWLMGMVKRVLTPGSKVDNMPVFEGPQGGRKSTALGVIGGKWYAECHEPVTSKDFYQVMQGCMLIEISELHAFRRSEVERIKGIITCQVDRYRKSYGRRAEDHPRMSVFSGTTNVDDWQADETGARRFWPIACGFIDTEWLEENREQLFAEAVFLINDGEKWWTVPEGRAMEEQEKRRKHDEWEGILSRYITSAANKQPGGDIFWQQRIIPLDEILVADFLLNGLDIAAGKWSRSDMMRVSGALKSMGWKRKRIEGIWMYISPDHRLSESNNMGGC